MMRAVWYAGDGSVAVCGTKREDMGVKAGPRDEEGCWYVACEDPPVEAEPYARASTPGGLCRCGEV